MQFFLKFYGQKLMINLLFSVQYFFIDIHSWDLVLLIHESFSFIATLPGMVMNTAGLKALISELFAPVVLRPAFICIQLLCEFFFKHFSSFPRCPIMDEESRVQISFNLLFPDIRSSFDFNWCKLGNLNLSLQLNHFWLLTSHFFNFHQQLIFR